MSIKPVLFIYSVYGLQLHSDAPIPGLLPLETTSKADVLVWLERVPPVLEKRIDSEAKLWYSSFYKDEEGQPLSTVWQLADGEYWQVSYSDRTEFIIDRAGTEIWATWPENLTLEDTATYLLGPILGFVLRLRGVTCLHASAVGIGDKCLVILGGSGAGKSTTAAAFAKAGFPVLSDDVVALLERDGKFLVQPAYPRLRLWPASVKALYGEQDALPCLTPNWDKRYLDLTQPGYQFQSSPLALGAIYILGDRTTSAAAPFLEAIAAHSGLITLITNTYANTLLDKKMRAKEFNFLSMFVNIVPLRRVTPHADTQFIPKLCNLVLEDFYLLVNN